MTLEEQAAFLQQLRAEAKLNPDKARDKLLSELTDTVSLLCHQVYRLSVLVDAFGESLEDVQAELDALMHMEPLEEEVSEEEETVTDRLLYEVKCPQCSDRFAVDEATLLGGFSCPTCGEHLVQAEDA